ncbi:MAG: hypothetical protein WAN36_10470, partial [Calditrichia bacterium]
WHYINKNVPETARILSWSGGDHFFSDRDRLWAVSAMAHPLVRPVEGTRIDVLQRLYDSGITHLILEKYRGRYSGDVTPHAITAPDALNKWYEVEYSDNYYILYRIRWEELRGYATDQKRIDD